MNVLFQILIFATVLSLMYGPILLIVGTVFVLYGLLPEYVTRVRKKILS